LGLRGEDAKWHPWRCGLHLRAMVQGKKEQNKIYFIITKLKIKIN